MPRLNLPKIYLAGKISKNCWRHSLVPRLRQGNWDDGALDCESFVYVGPFFESCDHGCYHEPTGHGNIGGNNLCQSPTKTQEQVRTACLRSIDTCDILFAYIDTHECYGTVAEIQYARGKDKTIVIIFGPEIATPDKNEFWFVQLGADVTKYNVPGEALPGLLETILEELWI